MTNNNQKVQREKTNNLVTERDIDPDFGLFTEGSFPGALEDKDQQGAIQHAIPKDHPSYEPSSDKS
ncbi:hypothetical protein AB4Z30_10910 [Paenibacillus sp. 2TAF8]|uniref:hypothetical protein n=1 Tax=Paenibacillus sp. 2TAF8 TaxID=3233020 RepID=UPI003F9CBF4D